MSASEKMGKEQLKELRRIADESINSKMHPAWFLSVYAWTLLDEVDRLRAALEACEGYNDSVDRIIRESLARRDAAKGTKRRRERKEAMSELEIEASSPRCKNSCCELCWFRFESCCECRPLAHAEDAKGTKHERTAER